jgi:hypothetical protein
MIREQKALVRKDANDPAPAAGLLVWEMLKLIVLGSVIAAAWALLGSGASAHAEPAANFGPKRPADSAGAPGSEVLEGAPRPVRIPAPAEAFPADEKLEYRINWWGVEIGTTEILITETEEGGRPMYHIEAAARDNDYLRKIFPVEDAFGSRMDPEGHSLFFERNVKEGKYRAHETTTLDRETGRATRLSMIDGSAVESAVAGPVHDALTAFYWARRQPLEVGGAASTQVFLKEKTWDLTVRAKEVRSFALPGEKARDVVVLVPEVSRDGVRADKAKARIYVTADERRVPVLIRLDTPYGPVTGVLKTPLKP